jgi:hypothetical protein
MWLEIYDLMTQEDDTFMADLYVDSYEDWMPATYCQSVFQYD